MSESNLYSSHVIELALPSNKHSVSVGFSDNRHSVSVGFSDNRHSVSVGFSDNRHSIDIELISSISNIITPEISQALAIWYVFGNNVITYNDKYFGKIYFK